LNLHRAEKALVRAANVFAIEQVLVVLLSVNTTARSPAKFDTAQLVFVDTKQVQPGGGEPSVAVLKLS
jgi:hypothetical protein